MRNMIKFLKRDGYMLVWDIDGTEIMFKYLKSRTERVSIEKIKQFKETLQSDAYKYDESLLLGFLLFFGIKTFVNIGMVWRKDFIRCFSYYSDLYVAEWAKRETKLNSKNVSTYSVFARMLYTWNNAENKLDININTISALSYNSLFSKIANMSFQNYWTPILIEAMCNTASLKNICQKIGSGHVSRYLMDMQEETAQYIQTIARQFTEKREIISYKKINEFIFGEKILTSYSGFVPKFPQLLKAIAKDEYEIQKQRFIAENVASMDMYLNLWTVYYWHAASLNSRNFDFTKIHCVSMRLEVKYYIKHHFSGAVNVNSHLYSNIVRAVNVLCANNPAIRYFADIDNVDVKALHIELERRGEIAQPTIMSTFYHCRMIMDYLMGDDRDLAIRAPRPYLNPFKDVIFVNAKKYNQSTPYIPEEILDQIEEHLYELSESEHLVFQIFMETGMRAKEIAFIEEGCLEKARYDGRVKLRYIPYKTLISRRRAKLEDYHYIYISKELARRVSDQSVKTQSLRTKYKLPYIFLCEHAWNRTPVINTDYFAKKINSLIKRHNICDQSGMVWHFGNRQCRKTLAVNMIENGATVEELTYQFAHLDVSTVTKFYTEVKAMQLSELNSAFFRKQFEVLISKEALCEYTEEERRQLYVDFRLGLRRVELGFCAKRLSEGVCENRNRLYNCVGCRHLCTGNRYLPYWNKLLDAQKNTLDALLEIYKKEGVDSYHDFIEYRQEKHLFEAYKRVTVQILESRI